MTINVEINGRKVSAKEALDLITKAASGPLYYSHSKGEHLVIKDMPTPHIKNALSKKARSYFEKLTKVVDLEAYLDGFIAFAKEDEVEALFNELVKRLEDED